ncbi:MAG: outer membrane beta-barrel protein [Sandaracinaceae bacterium]|nr:outer membrane beta-barrel protein [Sandaracinaceae bacterium]
MVRHLTAAALLASLFTAPTLARADFGEGAFRLGAGPTLLSVEHLPEPDVQIVTYGLPPLSLGVHVGYMLTEQLYLGAQVALGGQSLTGRAGPFGRFNDDTLYVTLLPRIAYLISVASAVSIYFGAEVGLTIQGDPDGDPDDVFRAGGLAGLHFFATDSFSIDGELGLGFTHRVDSANAGVVVSLGLTFSGWLGGRWSGRRASGGGGGSSAPSSPPPSSADPEGGME